MFKLREIPDWMEPYISVITDGEITTIEELKKIASELKPWMGGWIVNFNNQLNLLQKLKDNDLLK